MAKRRLLLGFLLPIASIALLSTGCALGARSSVPQQDRGHFSAPEIPEGVGVNIHFTDPQPEEMKMLAASGVRWVRMDFYWQRIETQKGRYDFTPYDRLMATLDQYHLRALFILDYSNKLYDEGKSPHTSTGRQAFARWAAAAARHFRGRGIYWEIYNEPNIDFWTPYPNVNDYTLLALECAKAIREAAPEEALIGPAVSLIDFRFLEQCFKAGLLEYWTAVSVHPYRRADPETVIEEYGRLRRLIDGYTPPGKRVHIISGEWGYTSASHDLDESWQAVMLSRTLLVNQSNGVALSIWYDWHDDGEDPKNIEHHYGLVFFPYHADRDPVYDAKPSYRAMQTLNKLLAGYRFSEKLTASNEHYILAFRKGDSICWAVWTTSSRENAVRIEVRPGKYRIFSHTGELVGLRTVAGTELTLAVTHAPQYIVPD